MRLLLLLLAACAAETRFVRTDDSFVSAPAASAPKVYFDALPETPYRAVGIISVEVDVLAGRGTIAEAAAAAGQRAGCAVLVERKLHQKHGALTLMLVHDEPGPSHENRGSASHRIEFVCGVPVTRTAWSRRE
jgi:hypothetical protein